MSAAATKCHVGRSTCVRRIAPELNASSMLALWQPGARRPTAHFAAGKSCACIAPSDATTWTGSRRPGCAKWWLGSRSVISSSGVAAIDVDATKPVSTTPASSVVGSVSQGNGGVKANTKHRSCGELDVLAFSRCNHAAAADQDAGNGTLHAAENAADDGADTGTRADALGLALEAFTFERLCGIGANVHRAPVHLQSRKHDRQLALAVGAAGAIDRGHVAFEDRACRNQQVVALIQVDHRRRFNPIFDLSGFRIQVGLKPRVNLAACGDRGTTSRAAVRAWRALDDASVGGRRATAGARHEPIDALAQIAALTSGHRFAATRLDPQVRRSSSISRSSCSSPAGCTRE